jgi:hypothetical protein
MTSSLPSKTVYWSTIEGIWGLGMLGFDENCGPVTQLRCCCCCITSLSFFTAINFSSFTSCW